MAVNFLDAARWCVKADAENALERRVGAIVRGEVTFGRLAGRPTESPRSPLPEVWCHADDCQPCVLALERQPMGQAADARIRGWRSNSDRPAPSSRQLRAVFEEHRLPVVADPSASRTVAMLQVLRLSHAQFSSPYGSVLYHSW